MKKRPMKDLLVSLEKLGAHIEYDENEYHFLLPSEIQGSMLILLI